MKMIRIAVLAALATAGMAQAGVVFSVSPVGGALTGTAGAVVGWGFTFANDTDFALITSADYITGLDVGVFTDLISPQFNIIGPSPELTSWTQAFDDLGSLGVGRFQISSSAVPGLSTGTIQVTYDLYSVSPNSLDFNPDTDLISGGNVIGADASVEVLEAASLDTPEPASAFLLLGALSTLAVARRHWLTRLARRIEVLH